MTRFWMSRRAPSLSLRLIWIIFSICISAEGSASDSKTISKPDDSTSVSDNLAHTGPQTIQSSVRFGVKGESTLDRAGGVRPARSPTTRRQQPRPSGRFFTQTALPLAVPAGPNIPIEPSDTTCTAWAQSPLPAALELFVRLLSPSGTQLNAQMFTTWGYDIQAELTTPVNFTGTYRCEASFWFNNEFIGTSSNQFNVNILLFTISIETYIPEAFLLSPGLNYIYDGGTKTFQYADLLGPRATRDLLYNGPHNSTGLTIEWDTVTSAGPGGVTQEAFDDWVWGHPMKLRLAHAPTSSMRCNAQKVNADVGSLYCTGDISNPLWDWGPLNSIGYEFTITLNLNGSSPFYTVIGNHDGFPNYRITLDGREIYFYDHGSQTVLSLGWPWEQHASTLGPINYD